MGTAHVWVRTDDEGDSDSMEIKTQLPKVGIGRRCGAIEANLGGYRGLMSDEEYEELITLAKSLQGVKMCHVNSTAASGAWC